MADASDPGSRAPVPSRDQMTMRVADADRDRAVSLLREHLVDGRLTLDEFSQRVGLVLGARVRGELDAALADLPPLAEPTVGSVRPTARRRFVAVLSGTSAKGRWRMAARTTAVAVMGGCQMDLRQAEIDGDEVVISAVAVMGGITVTVPEGFDVQLEGFSVMGGRDLRLRDVPVVPGSPRIRIRGYAVMGSIEVRSRPNRSGREMARTVVENVLDSISATAGDSSAPIDLAALGRDIRAQIRDRRRSDPPGPPGPAPEVRQPYDGTVTILFSDMVNYAGMTEALGDAVSRDLLREHHRIVRAALERHGGREVKVQGDGFMIAFGGVARALRCAVDLQRAFAARTATHPIAVHVGVHTGEAVEEDDDFLGHTVIVASRLADAAGPGEILVSSLSEQLVAPSGEFSFTESREAFLKGMTRPQRVASLSWAPS